MNLQTKLSLKQHDNNQIDYNSKLLLLGSCFSENISEKLNYFKFQYLSNPFGILFQPKAIETLINNAINEKEYSEKDVFFQNEQWYCFEAHSKLSNASKTGLLNDLNYAIKSTKQQIQESTQIIITLGTAWVYNHIKSNKIVANCHKVHQKEFKKELLSVEAVLQSLNNMVSAIQKINSKTKVIFTVSPVRHIKDGFIENTQSKSHLIAAIHQFLNQKSLIGNQQSFYFPSYEIMMDELRDYRFYKDDMLHPNNLAVNYIWDKFQSIWISKDASKTMSDVDVIQKRLQHKPFNPKSEAHLKFLKQLNTKIAKLQSEFPQITFH